MPIVIIEPDSLSAWLGLAGTGVGALLTGLGALGGRYLANRQESGRAITAAATDLIAAADNLEITVRAFESVQAEEGAVRAWIPAITGVLDRIQIASATIGRLGTPAYGAAADALATSARDFARALGGSAAGLHSATAAFKTTSNSRKG